MPFLPFVLLLAWQAVSKSASFMLGWATAIYFGQVPGKQGRILAVISLASAAWVIVVVGFAVPMLAGAGLDALGVIGRNFRVDPVLVAALFAGIALGPPVIAALTILVKFHDDRSIQQWLRMLPGSYPAVASLGLGVLQMVVFTPVLIVQRLVRKQSLLQTAVSMRERTGDDDLVEAVAGALHQLGIERVQAEKARGMMAWPMRTVGYAARHLIGAVVRGEPMQLRADGLRLFAYATNVAILGPSATAHRARAVLERSLPFDRARITWNEDAQGLEDAILEARRDAAGDLATLHRALERVQERIDSAPLSADEWNLLYRLRLQAEHEVAERRLHGPKDANGSSTRMTTNGRPRRRVPTG